MVPAAETAVNQVDGICRAQVCGPSAGRTHVLDIEAGVDPTSTPAESRYGERTDWPPRGDPVTGHSVDLALLALRLATGAVFLAHELTDLTRLTSEAGTDG